MDIPHKNNHDAGHSEHGAHAQQMERTLFVCLVATLPVFILSDMFGMIFGMQFSFYGDNGMFRLNVPNDVPNVQWVHGHRDGLALIQRGPTGGAPIRLTIHLPGAEANEIIDRSLAMGSWGKTSTRLDVWFGYCLIFEEYTFLRG